MRHCACERYCLVTINRLLTEGTRPRRDSHARGRTPRHDRGEASGVALEEHLRPTVQRHVAEGLYTLTPRYDYGSPDDLVKPESRKSVL